jgi:phage-related minor tail protein
MKKLFVIWIANLRAETPKVAKIIRTMAAIVAASAGTAASAFNSLPDIIQNAIPAPVLTTIAITTAICAIIAQSQKKKE